MNTSQKCRYMQAAYPDLDAADTCEDHEHTESTFALGRKLAEAFQETPQPTDEQVAWFLNDAQAVIEDFDAEAPRNWTVGNVRPSREHGIDMTFDVNGVEFVIQTNDSGGHVESTPVSRSTWDEWTAEAEEDDAESFEETSR